MIEANGVMFGFCCGLQMQLFGYKDGTDKVNIVFMVLIFFSIIFYASSFYLLVGAFNKKKYSSTLLVYTKLVKKSLFFEPLVILTRSCIKSFFHSYLLLVYSSQIVLLLIIDLIFVIFSLSMKNLYRNNLIFFFLTSYLLGFAAFDFYFVLQQHKWINIGSDDRELYGFIACCFLSFITILLSLCLLCQSIIDIYKSITNIKTKTSNSSAIDNSVETKAQTKRNLQLKKIPNVRRP